MPKFTSIFDTDTKQSSFYIDDQQVSATDFSVGKYKTYTGCCTPDSTEYKMCSYASFCFGDEQNNSSYNFSALEGEDLKSSVNTSTVLSRTIGNVIDSFRASDKLIKILSKTESQTISIEKMLEDMRKLNDFNPTEDKQDTCPKDA